MNNVIPFPQKGACKGISTPSTSDGRTIAGPERVRPAKEEEAVAKHRSALLVARKAEAIRRKLDAKPLLHNWRDRALIAERLHEMLAEAARLGVKKRDIAHNARLGSTQKSTNRLFYYTLPPNLAAKDRKRRATSLARRTRRYLDLLYSLCKMTNQDENEHLIILFDSISFFNKDNLNVELQEEEVVNFLVDAVTFNVNRIIQDCNLVSFFSYMAKYEMTIDDLSEEIVSPRYWDQDIGLSGRAPSYLPPAPRVHLIDTYLNKNLKCKFKIYKTNSDKNITPIEINEYNGSLTPYYRYSLCIGPISSDLSKLGALIEQRILYYLQIEDLENQEFKFIYDDDALIYYLDRDGKYERIEIERQIDDNTSNIDDDFDFQFPYIKQDNADTVFYYMADHGAWSKLTNFDANAWMYHEYKNRASRFPVKKLGSWLEKDFLYNERPKLMQALKIHAEHLVNMLHVYRHRGEGEILAAQNAFYDRWADQLGRETEKPHDGAIKEE